MDLYHIRGRGYADLVKIFVETTIPSYLVARPSRDIVQMARQQITRDWWERCRGEHELFTSQIVLDEAGAGDATLARAAASRPQLGL